MNIMPYKDLFDLSDLRHPEKFVKLSPAACGFLLPEVEQLIEKYEAIASDRENPVNYQDQLERHRDGLIHIRDQLRGVIESMIPSRN